MESQKMTTKASKQSEPILLHPELNKEVEHTTAPVESHQSVFFWQVVFRF